MLENSVRGGERGAGAPAGLVIREYVEADRAGLLECIAQLQEYEKGLEDNLLGGEVAEAHLAYLHRMCRERNGKIFVALARGRLAGFVCAWAEEEFGGHLALPRTAGYVSDVMVWPEQRGTGLGRALMAAAEEFVRSRGVSPMTLIVLARNRASRRFYAAAGYREYDLTLVKDLL